MRKNNFHLELKTNRLEKETSPTIKTLKTNNLILDEQTSPTNNLKSSMISFSVENFCK
jgi:hypothetical protein